MDRSSIQEQVDIAVLTRCKCLTKPSYDALLATCHLEQLVVQCYIPVPRQTAFCEGLVEGDTVRIFSIGQCAVHVKYDGFDAHGRSEEHTSELQSLRHLVCRLLLENK